MMQPKTEFVEACNKKFGPGFKSQMVHQKKHCISTKIKETARQRNPLTVFFLMGHIWIRQTTEGMWRIGDLSDLDREENI